MTLGSRPFSELFFLSSSSSQPREPVQTSQVLLVHSVLLHHSTHSVSPILSPHKLNWPSCSPAHWLFQSVLFLHDFLISTFDLSTLDRHCMSSSMWPSINFESKRVRAHDSWQQQTLLKTSSTQLGRNYHFRRVLLSLDLRCLVQSLWELWLRILGSTLVILAEWQFFRSL